MWCQFSRTIILLYAVTGAAGNQSPVFIHDMDNTVLSEGHPPGSAVDTLVGSDPEGGPLRYGIVGTDRFKVDPDTGLVTLVKPLDREVNDTLRFYVTLEDDVNNLEQIQISVIVVDENDNPPSFKNTPYECSVPEDTAVGTTVFRDILVEDPDLTGETLEIACNNYPQVPDACDKFEVVAWNSSEQSFMGGIVLKEKISYLKRQFYQLLLVATDGKFSSTTGVEIKVGDIQDTPPVFQGGSLTGVIEEDDPIGSLVMTVSAKDGDKGNPRKIVYDLLTNPLDYFLLDSDTGELRIAKPLDREALQTTAQSTGVISLTVRARELVDGVPGNDSSTTTMAMASVTIKDVNDEPPQFNQKEYMVTLTENLPLGTPLPNLNMTVTDPDIGPNSKFSLRLSDVSGAFAIEPTQASGSTAVSIRLVNGPLDYENPNHRKFIVLVIAEETMTLQRLSSTATVTVEVTDWNDNLPVFNRESYSATIAESALPGDLITKITATDSDTGSFGPKGIVYDLIGHGSEKFNVNRKTGEITVSPCPLPGSPQCLDFETKDVYYLQYKATDDEGKGHTTVVPLKISVADSNDNPPVFTSQMYKAIIDEGSSKFEPPLQVEARDSDKTSKIDYSIIDGNAENLFTIDRDTGEITVTDKKGLDMTNMTGDIIRLHIQASDGVFTANCTVEITVLDVNNNNPMFDEPSYVADVPEDTPIGTSISQVHAQDADTGINANLIYKIEKGAFEDFGIDNSSGVISVVSKLDFDRRSSYTIHIIAIDGGTPALTGTTTLNVHLINSNDKIPFFSPTTQRAEVKEDAKVGDVVWKLVAKDLDIDSSEALNYAASEPITAVNKNGNEVVDNMVFKDFFSIDQTTGTVTVARPLDREVAAVVRITVLVTDITARTMQQGTGTLIITIIDVNDFSPAFLKPWTVANPNYNVEMLEEQPPDTILGTFTATDQDSNVVHYAIQPESDYYTIDNTTGVVKSKVRIDYEKTPVVEFKIVAYDSGVPQLSSTANVRVSIVNINDMDPVFTQPEYTFEVLEGAVPGTVVGKVSAVDGDSGKAGWVSYSLADNNNDFSIDRQTGQITVSVTNRLDRETAEEVTLQVVATDGALGDEARSATVPVHIKINDVNDNRPIFSQHAYSINIVESIPLLPRAPILQLRAVDSDSSSSLRYSIVSGNVGDVFMLDPVSGIMFPRVSLKNQQHHYMLGVEVSDGIHKDSAQVDITVQAINEHQPVFVEPSNRNATVYVKENNLVSDAVVMIVKATDGDTGENGRVTYHFNVNDENVQETKEFTINENTGELRAKIPLDREVKSTYQLVLVARDHGTPTWYKALRFVTIALEDVDDNLPEFPDYSQQRVFNIIENSAPHTRIGQVLAVDRDEAENAKIYYYLVGEIDGFFIIDRLDGNIYTNTSLDRETRDTYNFYVKATNDPDHYPSKDKLRMSDLKPMPNLVHVKINVLDENDNPPVFQKSEYNAGVSVTAGAGEFVTQLVARDDDSGVNGSLTLLITASHLFRAGSNVSSGSVVPSPFAISDSGKLTAAGLVAEYNQERFRLEVVAKEKSAPFREANAVVNIWVYEQSQLIRVILSRPPEEVHREKEKIILELSNATRSLVVIDDIKDYVDPSGRILHDRCNMYLHVVDRETQTISTIPDVLKIIDSQYDVLKEYYVGFAIENVLPAYMKIREDTFEPALAALIALLIILFVGCISVIVVCCCFRHWVVSEPMDMKQSDMLIKKTVIDDLNTTENPLWIEQKLKLYEEQELTMQVFCEPEGNQIPTQATMERRDSADLSMVDNTYATIQQPNRRGSLNTMLSLGAGDYATLGGSVLPLDNVSSHSQQMLEAALGFQGSTFQVPESADLFRARSELRMNKDGQPEFVSELI